MKKKYIIILVVLITLFGFISIINYFEKLGCSKNIQKSRSISDIHFSHTKALFVLNEMYKDSTVYLDRKYEIYKKYS